MQTTRYGFDQPKMGPREFATVIMILHSCYYDINLSPDFIRFLTCYLSGEQPQVRAVIWHSQDARISGTLRAEFHFRCFGGGRVLGRNNNAEKISCRRFQSLDLDINISERRRSLVLLSQYLEKGSDPETTSDYVILELIDDNWNEARSRNSETLQLCQPWAGITMFQRLLYQELGWWAENWREALHIIDKLVKFEVPITIPLIQTIECRH